MYDLLIKKIKEKKPLDRLDDSFVLSYLTSFFKLHSLFFKKFKLASLKKRDVEKIVKWVRNELNKVYGQFWLENSLQPSSHKSSKERLDFYHRLYPSLFKITGIPKRILDLGAGLNPLSYKDIPCYKNIYFFAVELTSYDCTVLKEYFKKEDIQGEVLQVDLKKSFDFPNVDVCFMFKLLDTLEDKGHLFAEHLLKNISASYFIVSFSTATIRGKKMHYPRRGWLEMMLARLALKYTKYEEANEVFYIIKK